MNDFDESEAIEYMRRAVGESVSALYDDNEFLNVIDMIFDYYEANGLLEIDIDSEDEDEVDIDDIVTYVTRMLARDKGAKLRPEHARPLVSAYIDYENSLDN